MSTMPSILTCEVGVTVYRWTQCIVSLYLLLAHLNPLEGKRKHPSFWYLIINIILLLFPNTCSFNNQVNQLLERCFVQIMYYPKRVYTLERNKLFHP